MVEGAEEEGGLVIADGEGEEVEVVVAAGDEGSNNQIGCELLLECVVVIAALYSLVSLELSNVVVPMSTSAIEVIVVCWQRSQNADEPSPVVQVVPCSKLACPSSIALPRRCWGLQTSSKTL